MIVLVLAIAALVAAENWAILVAGSNTYGNYRHQADVCQAYQEIHSAGIPEDKIIVWMYDDIANNPQNPKKGSIINYLGGPNVYPGVPKDYTRDEVIPENFLKLLHGKDMTGIGSGKSLKSGPDDNVFIYFTDHGGPGVICFPGFIELHVKDLLAALKYMHDNSMYKQLVFYMEACESGSMFNKVLPSDWNIYAVTASNPSESSWACDWSSDYEAYLNDCWSRDWLNDTRWALNNKKMDSRTLDDQFEWVHSQSTRSPECRYGDLSIAKQPLANFQGAPSLHFKTDLAAGIKTEHKVPTHDVKLATLEKAGDEEALQEYRMHRFRMDLRWGAFVRAFDIDRAPASDDTCTQDSVDVDCMKDMIEGAKRSCGGFDEYSSKFYNYLHYACQAGVKPEAAEAKLAEICQVA